MKIVRTEGCVVSGLDIDEKDYSTLTEEEKQSVWIKILEDLEEKYSEYNCQELINWYLDTFGEYKHLYTCEQCGDSVGEYTIEI